MKQKILMFCGLILLTYSFSAVPPTPAQTKFDRAQYEIKLMLRTKEENMTKNDIFLVFSQDLSYGSEQ